jgi:hypothetical protein
VAFKEQMIEEILDWCVGNRGLGPELRRSRHQFFAEGDPRPLKYWPGAEGVISRERRFLGYFMFDHRLSTGETPAEATVGLLYGGAEKAEAVGRQNLIRYDSIDDYDCPADASGPRSSCFVTGAAA